MYSRRKFCHPEETKRLREAGPPERVSWLHKFYTQGHVQRRQNKALTKICFDMTYHSQGRSDSAE